MGEALKGERSSHSGPAVLKGGKGKAQPKGQCEAWMGCVIIVTLPN